MPADRPDLYADRDAMTNHWWWRPGWQVGTRFYAWHITLDDQVDLHALADKYAEALADVPTLDVIPRDWRHITLQGLGHVDEVSDDARDRAVDAVGARLRELSPIRSTFERAVVFAEAIALPPSKPRRTSSCGTPSGRASKMHGVTCRSAPTDSVRTRALRTAMATGTAARSVACSTQSRRSL